MQIIIDLIACFLLSAIPACFNYFLDYCLGHPMSDKISIKAIFFPYSYALAKKVLPRKRYVEIMQAFKALLNSDDEDVRRQGQDQLKVSIMMAGKEYFTFQQALGMCPFCTNFWISILTAIILCFINPLHVNPIFFFLLIPIFSHTILRKL